MKLVLVALIFSFFYIESVKAAGEQFQVNAEQTKSLVCEAIQEAYKNPQDYDSDFFQHCSFEAATTCEGDLLIQGLAYKGKLELRARLSTCSCPAKLVRNSYGDVVEAVLPKNCP